MTGAAASRRTTAGLGHRRRAQRIRHGDRSLPIRCLILSRTTSATRTLPTDGPATTRTRKEPREHPHHARHGRRRRRAARGGEGAHGRGRARVPLAGRGRPLLVRRADHRAVLAGSGSTAGRSRSPTWRRCSAWRPRRPASWCSPRTTTERHRVGAARARRRLRHGRRAARHRLGGRLRRGVHHPDERPGRSSSTCCTRSRTWRCSARCCRCSPSRGAASSSPTSG